MSEEHEAAETPSAALFLRPHAGQRYRILLTFNIYPWYWVYIKATEREGALAPMLRYGYRSHANRTLDRLRISSVVSAIPQKRDGSKAALSV